MALRTTTLTETFRIPLSTKYGLKINRNHKLSSTSVAIILRALPTSHVNKHLLYELVDQPFYYNTVAFFVSPILALGGLRDFETWQDICAIQKPGGRESVPLHYKEDFLNRPKPGAIRREGLLKVDMHGYSMNERMRHADHINPNTYGGYYQSGISTVDGQATFFGLEKQGTKLHEMFRGFSIHRNHNYNPKLPQNLHAKLDRHVSEAMKDPAFHEESSGPGLGQKLYEKKR
ncbi:hypothetical protein LTR92_011050 [Exophiala xenobiotica]|nr:hypothetical protein LTR92_011050 [Exophiala xenobiotica]